MAVFRIEKTRDYTVMANYHLRDKSLSLKAKGLLSLMLSLPDDWDYTTKGLAHICKDGRGQHLRHGAGAGETRVHPPPPHPQRQGAAWRDRVHHPRTAGDACA